MYCDNSHKFTACEIKLCTCNFILPTQSIWMLKNLAGEFALWVHLSQACLESKAFLFPLWLGWDSPWVLHASHLLPSLRHTRSSLKGFLCMYIGRLFENYVWFTTSLEDGGWRYLALAFSGTFQYPLLYLVL